jgi:hypothetical protein
MSTQIPQFAAKGPSASQLRCRKYELVRRFGLPENLLGGSLSQTHRRCGKPNCHCVGGRGHPVWSVTASYRGKRRVERVPQAWVEELEQVALATQAYLDALKEVMAINVELLAQARAQLPRGQRTSRVRGEGKKRRKLRKNDQQNLEPTDPLTM